MFLNKKTSEWTLQEKMENFMDYLFQFAVEKDREGELVETLQEYINKADKSRQEKAGLGEHYQEEMENEERKHGEQREYEPQQDIGDNITEQELKERGDDIEDEDTLKEPH